MPGSTGLRVALLRCSSDGRVKPSTVKGVYREDEPGIGFGRRPAENQGGVFIRQFASLLL